MKRILLSLLTLCAFAAAMAQMSKCDVATKALVAERMAAGDSLIPFLVKVQPDFAEKPFIQSGVHIGAQVGDIVTMRVPVGQLHLLEQSRDVLFYSIAHRVGGPTMDDARTDTRTDSVEAGFGLPDGIGYDGTGVYIGITDWGFDYTHTNYNGGSSTNRRIERAWDHFRLGGPAPEFMEYDYGTELKDYTSLYKAKGDTSNLYGYGTHGTHVAGIAAGAGSKHGRFRGQAPGARLLLCSFGLNENNWLDGVAWMHDVAKRDGKRLVINSSWGMYSFSCLDGKSLLSQAINTLSDEGVIFVTSAGNNGDNNFHISRDFSQNPDTLRTVAAYYTYAADAIGQCLILWGEAEHSFRTYFRLQQGDSVWVGPMVNTADGELIVSDTLQCDTLRVPYRIIAEAANPLDGRPHVQMDVDRVAGLQLQLFVIADDGEVHAWNVANKTNHAGNEGAAFFTGGHAGFAGGNNYYGVGEPACAAKNIAVAAHQADRWSADSTNYIAGDLAYFSSYGPALGNGEKPEISAPGYQVNSSISYWSDTRYYPTEADTVGMRIYIWSQMSGTSMSSPAVTGIVALLLQANPSLTADEVREIIIKTARNDSYTGPLLATDSASVRWGWGKIDALAAVKEAIRRVGIQQVEEQQLPLQIYPNPTAGVVHVNTGCGQPQWVRIFAMNGREVMNQEVATEGTLDVRHLAAGVYVVKVGSRTSKLIVR